MWVITVYNTLQEYRDSILSEMVSGDKPVERYLTYRYKRYNYTSFLPGSKFYKTKSGADRMLEKAKNGSSNSWRSQFYQLYGKHLSCRKLSIEEWNQVIDYELNNLERSYQSRKAKLEKKRQRWMS
jgi:hypothetical protein